MQRRAFLAGAAAALGGPAWSADAAKPGLSLGAAWRGPAAEDPQQLGVIDVDWDRRGVAIRHQVTMPGRAHGILPEAGGGLLAVAARPGTWLLRMDGRGRISQRQGIESEAGGRSFDGHALPSADGAWLYTGETDGQGRGWIGVRDRASLRKVDQWRTHGIDPHHLLLDGEGHLMLANGGIARTPDGRKRDLDRMASSLVRIDHRNGQLMGQWTLADPRLSLRHLAWSRVAGGEDRLLGVALQAEHDDAAQRVAAPLLALWDGATLQLPSSAGDAAGYAGDIAPSPGGGFALSAQRAHRGLAWSPQASWQRFAEVQEPCALAVPTTGEDTGAVLLACGSGIARWHPTQGPALLRWPTPMALDNHWVVLV